MKKVMLISFLLLIASGFVTVNDSKAQRDDYNYFYAALAPHGSWVEIDNGLLAWRPSHVGLRWSPYQIGRWAWTSDGWYWDSYEPFGDITYHYGRWYNDDYYGWMWVPDNTWGPAWVEWRYDDEYIGWSPLSPYALFNVSVGIRFSHHYDSPWGNWCFLRYRHFGESRYDNYYLPASYKHKIFSDTKYRNDYGYEGSRVINRGVDRNIIEKRGNFTVRQREVVRVNNPRADVTRAGSRIEVFAPGRDALKRGDVSSVKIERTERKVTLDVNKVDIGRREDRNANVKRDNTPNTRVDGNRNVEVKREVAQPARRDADPQVKRESKNVDTKRARVEERKAQAPAREQVVPERKSQTPVREQVVPERKSQAPAREQVVPERRSAPNAGVREEKRNTPNVERKAEVKENREEKSTPRESRNTDDRKRDERR